MKAPTARRARDAALAERARASAPLAGRPSWSADPWRTAELLGHFRGLLACAGRSLTARLALASVAVAARPAGDWSSCFVGAAAFASSFAGPHPARLRGPGPSRLLVALLG